MEKLRKIIIENVAEVKWYRHSVGSKLVAGRGYPCSGGERLVGEPIHWLLKEQQDCEDPREGS